MRLNRDKLWIDMFRHITKRSKDTVRKFLDGKPIGVDVTNSYLFDNSEHFESCAEAIGYRRTSYKPEELMNRILIRHKRFRSEGIEPIYVFSGQDNPKRLLKRKEKNRLKEIHDFYLLAIYDQPKIQRSQKWKRQLAAQIQKSHMPEPKLYRFLAEWMRSQGMRVRCAPYEATWQLVDMERRGIIGGIMSRMGLPAATGAQQLFLGIAFSSGSRGRLQAMRFNRSQDLVDKPHRYDFTGSRSEFFPEAYTMYGNDYFERVDNVFAKTVIEEYFPKYIQAKREGRDFWIDDMKRTEEFSKEFNQAVAQIRHGPVIRESDDGEYLLEPLNPLPEGQLWSDVLGFDPVENLPVEQSDYRNAFHFVGATFGTENNNDDLFPWYADLKPSHDKDESPPPPLETNDSKGVKKGREYPAPEAMFNTEGLDYEKEKMEIDLQETDDEWVEENDN